MDSSESPIDDIKGKYLSKIVEELHAADKKMISKIEARDTTKQLNRLVDAVLRTSSRRETKGLDDNNDNNGARDLICLNVGGRKFQIPRKTIDKSKFLEAAAISCKEHKEDEIPLLDVDPDMFSDFVECLTHNFPCPSAWNAEMKAQCENYFSTTLKSEKSGSVTLDAEEKVEHGVLEESFKTLEDTKKHYSFTVQVQSDPIYSVFGEVDKKKLQDQLDSSIQKAAKISESITYALSRIKISAERDDKKKLEISHLTVNARGEMITFPASIIGRSDFLCALFSVHSPETAPFVDLHPRILRHMFGAMDPMPLCGKAYHIKKLNENVLFSRHVAGCLATDIFDLNTKSTLAHLSLRKSDLNETDEFKVGDRVVARYKDEWYPSVLLALKDADPHKRYKVMCDVDAHSNTTTSVRVIKKAVKPKDKKKNAFRRSLSLQC